jgi:type I restriction enzyme, S subunit
MTVLAEPRCASGFGVCRSDLAVRTDVNYARMEPVVKDLLSRFRYPLTTLGRLTSKVQYGSSSKAVDEQVGTPMLRMTNIQDGDWDFDILKYTTLDLGEQAKYLLARGDLCFTRTNGSKDLVGKCAVFRDEGSWIYASYIIRVRIRDQEQYLPEFLARFLNSDVGRVQIDWLSRQALMTNINSDEIKDLRVPHPDPKIQDQMVRDLRVHRDHYRARIGEVRDLLMRGDEEIALRLDLKPPVPTNAQAWTVSRGAFTREGGRLNAEFFHPERLRTIKMLVEGRNPAHRMDTVADFVKDTQIGIGDGDRYIGLGNVERDTGELVTSRDEEDDLPTGHVVRFKAGDVLFGKLRPYLNKVHLADGDGVCSPEFFVLRPRSGIRGEYLAAILRSQLTLAQTRHMAGGNTHPRLTPADVHAMFIPVPDDDKLQNEIADSEAKNRTEARTLKAKADQRWTAAKGRFGDGLVT